ncbi:hypothetical protein PRIPAC_91051 [Pristionchus pacificus]|uniref:Uncharacterized protein n=1 Tax=Pristionchus pacificus TaxID=54126 RepID=A0A2A6B8T2_PRIPA|nr:hypothetical protein PRIPAC_91051 [Pristionchus pacificus]|eukprot:PDM62289.1 hypothetical protein PRIPAC_51731 [Pristionchus pacificus]
MRRTAGRDSITAKNTPEPEPEPDPANLGLNDGGGVGGVHMSPLQQHVCPTNINTEPSTSGNSFSVAVQPS